jgi:hypothetical protein
MEEYRKRRTSRLRMTASERTRTSERIGTVVCIGTCTRAKHKSCFVGLMAE